MAARNNQRNKMQHYVPRFYLELFTDPSGKVWNYDKVSDQARDIKSVESGVEKNLYSPKNSNGSFNDDLDRLFDLVESESAEIFKSFSLHGKFDQRHKELLSFFIAMLYVRSPAVMNAYSLGYGEVIQKITRSVVGNENRFHELMQQSDLERGAPTDKAMREKIRQFMLDSSKYKVRVSKKLGLMSVGQLQTIANYILRMNWTILDSPNQHFITSDCPVSQIVLEGGKVVTPGGFLHRDCKVVLAMNPSRALLCEWGGKADLQIRSIRSQFARSLNSIQAWQAERFLFSSKRDEGISLLAKKFNKPGIRLRVSGSSGNAPVVLKRS